MRLAALSAGGRASRGRFNGTVHSVFAQACNIRLDDGRMLALLAPPLGNVPHGVRVDAPAGFVFSRHLAVEQRVGCRADVLRVAGGLAVELGSARAWRGELPSVNVDRLAPEVIQAWRAAWYALQRGRIRADQADATALSRAVERQGVSLARVVRALQADDAPRILERVIGCGPGLTPSGDDLVTGFLAGLFSGAGEGRARRGFLEAFCRTVAAAAVFTADISRTYLSHAVAGWFAEPLATLARQIGAGADRDVIERATIAALRLGHTSGGAGVFGLLLGLNAWAAQAALLELTWPRPRRAGPDLTGEASCRVRPDRPRAALTGEASWSCRVRPDRPHAALSGEASSRVRPDRLRAALSGEASSRVRPDRPHAAHRTATPPRRSHAALGRTSTFAC
jgi:hypothetical protein